MMDANPLLLPEIVERVFAKMSLRSLSNCRLVCRLWNHVAKRSKLKWISVKIMRREDINNILDKISSNSATKIYKMTTIYLNLQHPGFNILLSYLGFSLSTLVIGDDVVTVTNFGKLLRQLPCLTRLEVGNISGAGRIFPIYDYDFVPPKMMVFDKIVALKFDSCKIKDPLVSVFKTFPKLDGLCVFNFRTENFNRLAAISIPILRNISLTCPLGDGFSNRHLEMLRKMNINSLNGLRICNFRRDVNIRLFKNFVETQKDTLKALTLFHKPSGKIHRFPQYFPIKLPNLIYLSVSKTFVQNLSLVCSNSPELRYINFKFERDVDWMKIFTKNIEPKKSIKFCRMNWIDSMAINPLASMFPCITGLIIVNCTNEILRAIYLFMPNLQLLRVMDSEDGGLTEKGFTGIRSNHLVSLVENWNSRVQVEGLDELRQFPSITCLKKLKHVILRIRFAETFSLSIILIFGILQCRSLLIATVENVELCPDLIRVIQNDFKRKISKHTPILKTQRYCYHIISGDIGEAWTDRLSYGRIFK